MENGGYISVYKPDETDFTHNGECILLPTACQVTEVLNGEYSLSLNHPLDPWGKWKYIQENNIIKVQGQLFRIYQKYRSMSTDGSYEIRATAMHISYDLNYYFIKDVRPTLKLPDDALEWITTPEHNGYKNILNGNPRKRFKFFTDLDSDRLNPDNYKTAYYEKMSVTKALIGADNSFVNVWGGEVLRDNFDFKILKNRGNNIGFYVRYGNDMTEIQEDTDLSDYCRSLYYEGTVYSEQIVAGGEKTRTETVYSGIVETENPLYNLPIQPMKFYGFDVNYNDIKSEGEYPTTYEVRDDCQRRAKEYLMSECQPIINLRVKFADLKSLDIYKEFLDLQKCELGDIGKIYHEILGIDVSLRIVKKTVDGITGETLSIELGNLKKSLTSQLAGKR